jgi:hypothetical protein
MDIKTLINNIFLGLKHYVNKFFGKDGDKVKYLSLLSDLILIFSVCNLMYNLADKEGDENLNDDENKRNFNSFQIFAFLFFLSFFSKYAISSLTKG